jgi:hypothetical protein
MNAIPHGWSIKSSDIWELGTHGSKTMRRVTLVNNRTGQFVHGDFWQAQVMKPKDYYRDVERTALAFAITLAAFNARIEDEKETLIQHSIGFSPRKPSFQNSKTRSQNNHSASHKTQ